MDTTESEKQIPQTTATESVGSKEVEVSETTELGECALDEAHNNQSPSSSSAAEENISNNKDEESSDIDNNTEESSTVETISEDRQAASYKLEKEISEIDDGDPIPSGTGTVSKDCTPSELIGWSEILPKWHNKLNQRPKGLGPLVRNGIPEPLRGEVWQLLSGAQQSADLMDRYRIFLTMSAPTEQIILRDVHRTYPAHENFQTGGSSSLLDSLFKVCKAYAVYDEEVGYCQGLSFLVAALLLHMPEEQAFCVFVRIMQYYGLRDLFRNNFDELYLKFYQLEHLLEDNMPDLYHHFNKIGIEPFTYASQWFLTVFTAKFPLNAVFHIMDIFLLDGMDTVFQIALALLGSSRKELLALDFEGVLKYFRVQMPKRYRNQDNVQQLISASTDISLKKLKKHAKNYELIKRREKLSENPLTRLQKENAKLTEKNLRLQQENDDLACDLVASKVQFQAQLDGLEDKIDYLTRALRNAQEDCNNHAITISDIEDEKARLEIEASQLKEVCRRELQRAESESARDSSIISDYKMICSRLSKRLDRQLNHYKTFVGSVQDSLHDNESCQDKSCQQIFETKAEHFLALLNSDDKQEPETDDNLTTKSNSSRRVSNESNSSNGRPVGALIKTSSELQSSSNEVKIHHLTKHIDDLEVELARTKLALVEAECKCQQLLHDLSSGVTVKTATSNSSSSLTGRLELMKAAMTTRRSPKVMPTSGGTLSKINNMISEKISTTIGSPSVTTIPASVSSSSNDNEEISPPEVSSVRDATGDNNNSNSAINQYQNQC